tara:strand:+ start:29 stop:178 length:150 start_codon:yes stop_codon:yes gene_type:complete
MPYGKGTYGTKVGRPAAKKKKAVPKGSHKMPDGTVMKNSAMPKKKKRKA